MPGGDRAARNQPSAAHRNHTRVEILDVFEQLQRGGTLARDGPRMIEWRHQGRAALLCNAFADCRAVFLQAVISDDAGPLRPGCLHLGARCVKGHHQGRRCAPGPRSDCHGLRVIAAGIGHHASRQLIRRKPRNKVRRATDLERPAGLQIFALKESVQSGRGVEAARTHHRSALGDGLDPRGGILNIGEGDDIQRGVSTRHACPPNFRERLPRPGNVADFRGTHRPPVPKIPLHGRPCAATVAHSASCKTGGPKAEALR